MTGPQADLNPLAATDDRGNRHAAPVLVAEIVRFSLADGVGEAAFLDLARAMQPALSAAPGYVSRRLSRGPDGSWTDHVVWATLDQALAAPAKVFRAPAAQAFGAAIDGASIDMRHEPILLHPE